jgi:hypothetical protein
LVVRSPLLNNLSFIYNVSEHVGPPFISGAVRSSSPLLKVKNSFDDVQLVQFFLNAVGDPKVAATPTATGIFDVQTGFWIYHQQNLFGMSVDGVVSPAKGITFGGGAGFYLIGKLNSQFQLQFGQAAFEDIPNRPELGSSLRASLSP